jgi:hypothetical protein
MKPRMTFRAGTTVEKSDLVASDNVIPAQAGICPSMAESQLVGLRRDGVLTFHSMDRMKLRTTG